MLEAPTNYLGMNALFGGAARRRLIPRGRSPSTVLRTIDDEEEWLPATHKKDTDFHGLPDTLRCALRCFLLATASATCAPLHGVAGRGGGIHRSMLVNVSRFTDVQNPVAGTLHLELEEIRRAVRLYGALPPQEAAARSPEITELAEAFDMSSATADRLGRRSVRAPRGDRPVPVQPVNQTTGAASLDYAQTDAPPGGESSRSVATVFAWPDPGGTFDELFLRNAKAYDTLLQMGRWFGYRDGYGDLCRFGSRPRPRAGIGTSPTPLASSSGILRECSGARRRRANSACVFAPIPTRCSSRRATKWQAAWTSSARPATYR